MTGLVIVRQTGRECMLQPLFLFIMIVELVVIFLLVFGLEFHYERGVLVSLELAGGTVRDDAQAVVHSLAETGFTLVGSILMFLLILMSSGLYSDLLRDPMLGIILTKSVSRVALFFSRFGGCMVAASVNILIFSVLLAVIIAVKTEDPIPLSLIAGGASFIAEFTALLSLCALLTMVVDHPFGITVVVAALYYLVSPLLADAGEPGGFTKLVSLLVPPLGPVSMTTRHIVLEGAGNANAILLILPYIALCLGGGAFLFHRKDLR